MEAASEAAAGRESERSHRGLSVDVRSFENRLQDSCRAGDRSLSGAVRPSFAALKRCVGDVHPS
jgi:hypothetical protein